MSLLTKIKFLLSEHPSVVNFQWSPTQSWAATWSFLFTSISLFHLTSVFLRLLLHLLRRNHKTLPLGPLPALHALSISLLSFIIFTGMLLSSISEIRDTQWLWRRSKTPFQWLLCFPLGTRPSGRVFFWSYIFYLSRFLHIFRTFFTILRSPERFPYFQVMNHSVVIIMSFLWLEFSQSFQVLGILSMSLGFMIIYGYRFCREIGVLGKWNSVPVVMLCRIVLMGMNVGWHVGVIGLHWWKGGCNGMGAWGFNTVMNSMVLLVLLNFYVKKWLGEKEMERSVDRVQNLDRTAYKRLNSEMG